MKSIPPRYRDFAGLCDAGPRLRPYRSYIERGGQAENTTAGRLARTAAAADLEACRSVDQLGYAIGETGSAALVTGLTAARRAGIHVCFREARCCVGLKCRRDP